MSIFIIDEIRFLAVLFLERIDDYITDENPVRVVDVFVDGIDLSAIGFKNRPATT